jgi:uridine kinase
MLLTLTGGSAAGKTTLAAELARRVPHAPSVIHVDDYYFGRADLGTWIADENGVPRLDVGDPRSVDWDGLIQDTNSALQHHRLVIVEGMFAGQISMPSTTPRVDVFVDVPADLRLVRKIDRQCVNDGFPLTILLRNYVTLRRDAHERHVEPLRHNCDFVVDGTQPPHKLAEDLLPIVAETSTGSITFGAQRGGGGTVLGCNDRPARSSRLLGPVRLRQASPRAQDQDVVR